MNFLRTGLGAAALMLTATTAMAADAPSLGTPVQGPYLTLGGVLNLVSKNSPTVDGVPSATKFKNGGGELGAFGYEWANGFRGEVELSHRQNGANYFDTNATPLFGEQRDTALMANVLYDLDTGSRWTPYVGAGVGIDWVQASNIHTVTSPVFNGTSSKFAWQAMAGVAYALDPNWKLIADFRYLSSDSHKYAGNVAGSTVTQYDNHTPQIFLGVRYSFGSAPAPVAAAAAAPAPAPAPAPERAPAPAVPQKFLVFFDFDKSNLRSDAQKIVAEAVEYAKTNGKATITATGHTDTSGTAAYNMALSERRAKTVEKELERLGIPASEVVVRWKGESEPLVQTGDGVKEPQNRRVEIVLE